MSQQRNQEIPLWANTSQQNSKMSQRQFNITRPTLINTSPTRVKTILTWTKTSQRDLNNPKKCDVLKMSSLTMESQRLCFYFKHETNLIILSS